ncbi:MAG: hypothetical protein AB7S41_15735 [Parvibaculaceae bacterium]
MLVCGPAQGAEIRTQCPLLTSDQYFFPANTFDDSDGFTRSWFGNYLTAAEEDPLSCGPPDGEESYRVIVAPSFSRTLVVRVTKSPDAIWLVAALTQRDLSYTDISDPMPFEVDWPDRLVWRWTRILSADDWSRVQAAVAYTTFWRAPPSSPSHGMDGTTWVIEGRKGNAYHAVKRWEGGMIKAFGEVLVYLSGWPVLTQ